MNSSLRQKLLFRRQYLYGPQFEDFPDWTRVRMPNGYLLAVHPDLNVVQVEEGQFKIVLLGYLLDPEAPSANDQQILTGLCKQSPDNQAFIAALDDLGGRYVLFLFTEIRADRAQ